LSTCCSTQGGTHSTASGEKILKTCSKCDTKHPKKRFLQGYDRAIAERENAHEEEVRHLQAQVAGQQKAQDDLQQSSDQLQAKAEDEIADLRKQLQVGV